MSLFVLKIIGIISMFIDHYHFVIGGPEILNIIGRIAFPIFSFSLGEGYFYTGNFKKYIGRLSFFAIISQIPAYIFYFAIWTYNNKNILFKEDSPFNKGYFNWWTCLCGRKV